jgi:dipicolinate synthase subunit B
MNYEKIRVGYAMTGSFGTLEEALAPMRELAQKGANVFPIFSANVAHSDTRFYKAANLTQDVEKICERSVIASIVQAEPIGPKALLDVLVIAPCTGNTLGKLAGGITDTAVTMACKAHLRNGRPVVIAVSTNDGLSASMQNIGKLMNNKNIFFVPFAQDDPYGKPTSLVAKFDQLLPTLEAALEGEQIQPVLARK